jgi:ubiquinone biosynthesis monooxygenase Coq7
MISRRLSLFDRLIINADQALRTVVTGTAQADRVNPSRAIDNSDSTALDDQERKHAAGLMRINHTGEVCAQALYQGQALTAKLPEVRDAMDEAAKEEIDHLVWCEQRINELNGRTSVLNPLFYGLSFTIGALAGVAGDKWSLGFVAATENQVCKHLEEHLQSLPESDTKSRAILEQMLIDEAKHATAALDAGGAEFPSEIKSVMSVIAKGMTTTTYRI